MEKIYGIGFVKTGKKGNYLSCKGKYLSKLDGKSFVNITDDTDTYYIMHFDKVEDRKLIYGKDANEKVKFEAELVDIDKNIVNLTNVTFKE